MLNILLNVTWITAPQLTGTERRKLEHNYEQTLYVMRHFHHKWLYYFTTEYVYFSEKARL